MSQLQNERLLIELIHAGADDDILREMFQPRLDNVDFEMIRQIQMANQLSDEALELISDLPRLAGSNAWAVSPSRSATAGALLASDPHLEINRLPAVWYEAVVQWGDRFVMGATLPGCPLFAVARTDSVAWGVTYMKGDTFDFFVEDCRPGSDGWQYRRNDEWHDFRVRRETVNRKGKESKTVDVLENDQGTIESPLEEMKPGYHLSMAWSGSHEGNGQAIGAWLDVIMSESVEQAMQAAETCFQPTLCWVFADAAGHIGLQGCGRFPRRGSQHSGLAPIPAWDPDNHWQGWLENDHLPKLYDPPEGYVATANEEINPTQGPMLVTQPLPNYRQQRIANQLETWHAATAEDMQRLQYDVYSLQAEQLLHVFLPHLPDGSIKERLTGWDRCYAPDSCEATLFQQLYRNVMMELLGKQVIGWQRMLYLCSRMGYSTMILTIADRILMDGDHPWWRGQSRGQLIERAAARLEEADLIPWSKVNSFHFTDRFFGNHQVGRILGFNSPPTPDARQPCDAVSGPRAANRQTRDDVRAVLSLRDRHGDPAGPHEPARRSQRKPLFAILQVRRVALVPGRIQDSSLRELSKRPRSARPRWTCSRGKSMTRSSR